MITNIVSGVIRIITSVYYRVMCLFSLNLNCTNFSFESIMDVMVAFVYKFLLRNRFVLYFNDSLDYDSVTTVTDR